MSYLNEVFLQTADGGYFDFTRCQKPNGQIYGTRGKCRSGTEIGAKEEAASAPQAAPAAQKPAKLGGAKVGTEKRLMALSVSQLQQLRADPRLYDYQKKKLDDIIAKKSPSGDRRKHEDIANSVMTDKKFRSDKARKAEMIRRGVPADTDFVALVADAKKHRGGEQPKLNAKEEREKRRADLIARIKKQEKSPYNTTLEEVDRNYKSMRDFIRQPGMDTPENRAAVTAMRALRMKMVYADIEKFRAKAKAKTEGLDNSPRYNSVPGSSKPIRDPSKISESAREYLELKKVVDERKKQLDELEKLPFEERKRRGYQELDDLHSMSVGAMTRLSRQRDLVNLDNVYEAQGFNAKPELVRNRTELEKRNDLVTRDDGRPLILYRGVLQEEFADQFRGVGPNGDKHYAGSGIFGNGTYAASATPKGDDIQARATAKEYAGWGGGPANVTAFGLRRDANVVDFNRGSQEERYNNFANWATDIRSQASNKTGLPINDIGEAAAIMGVHAYRVPQDDKEDYWVILNRGAIVAAADAQI